MDTTKLKEALLEVLHQIGFVHEEASLADVTPGFHSSCTIRMTYGEVYKDVLIDKYTPAGVIFSAYDESGGKRLWYKFAPYSSIVDIHQEAK